MRSIFAKYSAFILILLLSAAGNLYSQNFEGDIVMMVNSPEEGVEQEMIYTKHGDKVKMNVEAQGQKMDIIFSGTTMIMIMHDQKMYMSMDTESAKMENTEKAAQPKITKTGNTKELLGYTCHEYIIESDEEKVSAWMTEGLGKFIGGAFGPENAMGKAFEELGENAFPLMMELHQTDGSKVKVLEVKELKPRTVNDAEFEIPKGYQSMMGFGQ